MTKYIAEKRVLTTVLLANVLHTWRPSPWP